MEVKLCDVKYGKEIYAYKEAIKGIGLKDVLDIKLNNINKGIRYYTNYIKEAKVKMYNTIQEMINSSLMECHVNSNVTVRANDKNNVRDNDST